jgi:hypothetical protein
VSFGVSFWIRVESYLVGGVAMKVYDGYEVWGVLLAL